MTKEHIRNTILELFRQKEIMHDLDENEDFFERGVSSLSIVELQIAIEDRIEIAVPTNELMKSSTVSQWVDLYIEKQHQPS